jgi:hypothetical protein
MKEVRISVEIHCLEPRWVEQEQSKYRLYLDDEMLTERDWVWTQDTLIREYLVVEVSQGFTHTIRVDVIKVKPSYLTKLALKNLTVDEIKQNDRDGIRDNLSFILT